MTFILTCRPYCLTTVVSTLGWYPKKGSKYVAKIVKSIEDQRNSSRSVAKM